MRLSTHMHQVPTPHMSMQGPVPDAATQRSQAGSPAALNYLLI